jgi:hypothetical protein
MAENQIIQEVIRYGLISNQSIADAVPLRNRELSLRES